MRKKYEEFLVKNFPLLYTDYTNKDFRQSLMGFGFSCYDGWFPLLVDLSKNLTAEINKMPEKDRPSYRATQVKTKYAGLRFYMPGSDKIFDLINKAEGKSYKTCEFCGKKGKTVGEYWVYACCPKHHKDMKDNCWVMDKELWGKLEEDPNWDLEQFQKEINK